MSETETLRTPLAFQQVGGTIVHGAIVIGMPIQLSNGSWECSVALDGLWDRPRSIVGEDGLQALVLTLRLVARVLRTFLADGGTIFDIEGGTWPIDAYFPIVTE